MHFSRLLRKLQLTAAQRIFFNFQNRTSIFTRMYKYILFFVILCNSFFIATAQKSTQKKSTISGYVTEEKSGEKIIVGVNKFNVDKETPIPGFKIDDGIRQLQIEKLNILKNKRDQAKVNVCLEAIENAAVNQQNIMPVVIEAVENYCTLGEISDCLRKVFGEYQA